MSDEKEEGNSTPVNEVKDRKYGIGITRFFKVLGKDETRPKPCLNPIEHMKFVNKSPGKPRKKPFVGQARRRKTASSAVNLTVKNKAIVEENDSKTDTDGTKESISCKEIKTKKVTPRKRRVKKGGNRGCSEDIAKESSDPYSVDNSEDSDMIISYSAFLKDTMLKKKPTDSNETNSCTNESQKSITKYFSAVTDATAYQNGLSGSNNVNKRKKSVVNNSRGRNKRSGIFRSNLGVVNEEAGTFESAKTLKRAPKKLNKASISADVADDNCQSNLRRSSRLRKPLPHQLSLENFDDESTQSNDGVEKEKYACKVSMIDEENGKQSIKLRLTRISVKHKKSKAIGEKAAQKLIKKSKRRAAINQVVKFEEKSDSTVETNQSPVTEEEVIVENVVNKKYPLAPLFLKTNKRNFDEATIERRKQFLRSGIPESLQQSVVVEECCSDFLFPTIGHITQSGVTEKASGSHVAKNVHLRDVNSTRVNVFPNWEIGALFGSHRNVPVEDDNDKLPLLQPPTKVSVEMLPKILDEIQEKNPSFNVKNIYNSYASSKDPAFVSELHSMKKRSVAPVEKSLSSGCKRRKTTRNGVEQIVAKIKQKSIQSSGDEGECVNVLLSSCKGGGGGLESESDMWTNVYQPESSTNIIGNELVVKELTSFLARFSKRERTSKGEDEFGNDSASGSCDSNSNESRAALVMGPSGCGKSMTIYTIARELGYKVLEINASSKRSSKVIFSQLQEATQSHRVKETPILNAFSVQSDVDQPKQETATMSLILFEDVDIVFLEDTGFWSAVNDFISTTKRPVVLTTSDINFDDKCCIKGDYETYIFNTPDLNSQVVHMQLLCLTCHWYWTERDLCNLVSYNKHNFRRSVLLLQYLCNSEREVDEARKMSAEKVGNNPMHQYFTSVSSLNDDDCAFHRDVLYTTFQYLQFEKYQNNPLSSRASTTNGEAYFSATYDTDTRSSSVSKTLVSKLDDLCVLDCFSGPTSKCSSSANLSARLIDGIEDRERLFDVDWFAEKLTSDIQDCILRSNDRLSNSPLGPTIQSKSIDRIDVLYKSINSVNREHTSIETCSNHRRTLLSHMHFAHKINSGAFCLDILPALRAICRSEKEKQANNNKRSGRFLHYLSSVAFYFEPLTISELCNNLGPDRST